MTTNHEHQAKQRSHHDIWRKEEPEKPVKQNSKEVTKWVLRTLGILLILVSIIAGIYLMDVNVAQIVINVVNLRAPLDTVAHSNLISLTDDLVSDLGNPQITNSWEELVACQPIGCEDILYFGFLYTLISNEKVPHAKLIGDLIVTQRYWGTGEAVLIFSKSMADSDTGIKGLNSAKCSKIWEEIVVCDGTCENKNDLFFNLIKEVVKVQV